jgi:hypothetical protein
VTPPTRGNQTSENNTVARSTNKTLVSKPIPKKTTATNKARLADIDLDRVPVTKSLSLDEDAKQMKRSSNGGASDPPAKKPKLPAQSATVTTKKNTSAASTSSNSNAKPDFDETDDELALFDAAFTSTKTKEPMANVKKLPTVAPLSASQQLAARLASASGTSLTGGVTRAETSNDGRRIAHQPRVNPVSSTAPPQPLVDAKSNSTKIPLKTRQEYLNFFIKELKKAADQITDTAVHARAQAAEKEMFDKSANKNTYVNLAAKQVRQWRSEQASKTGVPASPNKVSTQRLVVSHSAMLIGGRPEDANFTMKKQKQVDLNSLTGECSLTSIRPIVHIPVHRTESELYTLMLTYKASEQDLLENGYPAFSNDFPDQVVIKNRNPLYNPSFKLPMGDRS